MLPNKEEPQPFPFEIVPQSEDQFFMLEALKEAWQAFGHQEVPIGAVAVLNGKIIAKGHNSVEQLRDATAHAEMLCITAASAAVANWRLQGVTLYCTIEPCSMCAGAMLLSRLPRLVWGGQDLRHGAHGSWVDLLGTPHPIHNVAVTSGILGEYAAELMRSFFRKRRQSS